MGQGIGLANILRAGADDDGQFNLPVGLDGGSGDHDRIVRADDGRGGLHEDDRFRRDGHAGFGGVVGVVQADADEFSGARDAGAKAGGCGDDRQFARVDSAQGGNTGIGQGRAADIRDMP